MPKRKVFYDKLMAHIRQCATLAKRVEIQNSAEELLASEGTPMSAEQITAVESKLNLTATTNSWGVAKTEYQNPTP